MKRLLKKDFDSDLNVTIELFEESWVENIIMEKTNPTTISSHLQQLAKARKANLQQELIQLKTMKLFFWFAFYILFLVLLWWCSCSVLLF